MKAWIANGNRLPHRVIKGMVEAGYLDTYHALHDEQQEMIGSFDTQQPGQRVDYIFAFGVLAGSCKKRLGGTGSIGKICQRPFPRWR